MIMSDGYSVDLDQFHGLDQIGEEGLRDKVNNHYLQIFGTSIALGIISGAGQIESGGGTITTARLPGIYHGRGIKRDILRQLSSTDLFRFRQRSQSAKDMRKGLLHAGHAAACVRQPHYSTNVLKIWFLCVSTYRLAILAAASLLALGWM